MTSSNRQPRRALSETLPERVPRLHGSPIWSPTPRGHRQRRLLPRPRWHGCRGAHSRRRPRSEEEVGDVAEGRPHPDIDAARPLHPATLDSNNAVRRHQRRRGRGAVGVPIHPKKGSSSALRLQVIRDVTALQDLGFPIPISVRFGVCRSSAWKDPTPLLPATEQIQRWLGISLCNI